ncbi:MAG TPA: RNA polymerase sigma-54 factor, partial [Bacteroidales bacterium]|nr:RNA polymerase sigma-54 factor [Bacteroidales bacterium]
MLNQKLQQRLIQKLSPQQVLVMRLLQEPVMSLEQRIKQELEENPALEEAAREEEEAEDIAEDQALESIDSEEDEFQENDQTVSAE